MDVCVCFGFRKMHFVRASYNVRITHTLMKLTVKSHPMYGSTVIVYDTYSAVSKQYSSLMVVALVTPLKQYIKFFCIRICPFRRPFDRISKKKFKKKRRRNLTISLIILQMWWKEQFEFTKKKKLRSVERIVRVKESDLFPFQYKIYIYFVERSNRWTK